MEFKIEDVKITRVNNYNYHLYEDMVNCRISGIETAQADKSSSTDIQRPELEDDKFYVFAGELQDRFIGWIHILIIPKIGKWQKGHLFVDELWVAPAFRRKGLALKLLSSIDLVKSETGIKSIRLITETESARKLYEKYGFTVVNECVFMEKNL